MGAVLDLSLFGSDGMRDVLKDFRTYSNRQARRIGI
jgi:hypothetical protein